MTRVAYLAGYLGHSPQTLLALCHKLNAVVIDVRWTPQSRDARWNRAQLRQNLGERYNAYRSLGNINHGEKGAPIQIADMPAGIAELEQYACPVILLCACRDGSRCHRAVIGAELRRRNWSVSELDWQDGGPA